MAEIEASSTSRADIQTAYNSASDGDIIILPVGDSTWDSPYNIEITKAVSFRGQGVSQTIIRNSAWVSAKAFFEYYWYTAQGYDDVEISHIKFVGPRQSEPASGGFAVGLMSGARDFKIHDCIFQDFTEAGIWINGKTVTAVAVRQPWGVIYDCDFINCYRAGYGYGVLVMGDDTWEDPLVLGGSNAVFIEDCTITGSRHAVASNAGSKYVFRYNTVHNQVADACCDAHGLNLYTHGSRSYEIYENDFTSDASNDMRIVGIRGGDGVVFNNTIAINYTGLYEYLYFVNEICPGCGDYPCDDQVRNAYVWGNTRNEITIDAVVTDCQTGDPPADVLQLDRDVFNEEKSEYTPYTYPHPLRGVGWATFQVGFSPQPHIEDATGNISDTNAKFNMLLDYLQNIGALEE